MYVIITVARKKGEQKCHVRMVEGVVCVCVYVCVINMSKDLR